MNWAYLAGFTDGDGCISREWGRGKRYPCSRIRWSQKASERLVLDEICAFLRSKGLKVSGRNFSTACSGHKYPQCELAITNAEDTRKALVEMMPYLVVKRQRAIEALAVLTYSAELKKQFGRKCHVNAAKKV
jgi:hypothetical protein